MMEIWSIQEAGNSKDIYVYLRGPQHWLSVRKDDSRGCGPGNWRGVMMEPSMLNREGLMLSGN